MRLNKNIKIFINYFLGPVLFGWLSFSIYHQINAQPQLQQSWVQVEQSFQSIKIVYLIFVLLLMFVNWGIEAFKWKLAVAHIYHLQFWLAFKAVITGVSFSVVTPNRVGEYIGRIMYLPEGSRLKTISVTLISSFSQLLVTIIFGTVSLLLLKNKLLVAGIIHTTSYWLLFGSLFIITVLLLLVYLQVANTVSLFQRWFANSRYLYLIQALQDFTLPLLLVQFLLSCLRYGVFMIQYFLLFQLFGVHVSVIVTGLVMSLVFLSMAILPTITLAEVGIRGEISLRLMRLFTTNSLGVGLTAVSAWFINLILPAAIGSMLLLSIKVFKRRNESA